MPNGQLNFPAGSTGSANLVNEKMTEDDVKALIIDGKITFDGLVVPPSQFIISPGGTYTKVSLVPEPSSIVLLLAFFGILVVGRRVRYALTR